MNKALYFDYHASTPVDPRVLEVFLPYFSNEFANPLSAHPMGWKAKEALEKARMQVATALHAKPEEIYFTGSATEANNWVIQGLWDVYRSQCNHVIVSAVEHKCILKPLEHLKKWGLEVTYIPVNSEGLVDPAAIEDAITDKTFLVSIMWANNEMGAIQPLDEIAKITTEKNVLLHSDAVQAIGKACVDLEKTKVDFLSLSAHKFYGPKGVGMLYKRGRRQISPLLYGGNHENSLRAGTHNLPGIVGLGRAIEIATQEKDGSNYRDHLQTGIENILREKKIAYSINGPKGEKRLCNNLSLTFKDRKLQDMSSHFRDLCYSTGSACVTGTTEPSHVLKACGLSDHDAANTMRLSTGRFTSSEEIEAVLRLFATL